MKPNATFDTDKVPTATKWIYSASGTGRDAAYTLVSLFLITYIQYTIRLTPLQFTALTAIIVVCRIWDAINDPMMGTIIENMRLKWGKYKPWVFFGALLNAGITASLFLVRPEGWGFVVFFGIAYLLWGMTFTMNDISYWSMLPSLSSDEKQRNVLTTLVATFASVGAFAVGGLVPMLVTGDAIDMYGKIAIAVAIFFLICQTILVLFAKERTRKEVVSKAPKLSLKSMFQIIAHNVPLLWMLIVILVYYLGSALLNAFGLNFFYFEFGYTGNEMFLFTVVYAAGTIISQIIYPLLSAKFKRKQLLIVSFVAIAIGYLAFFAFGYVPFLPKNILVLCVIGALVFSGQGVFYLTILIMMTNTIEYNEWKTGERNESIIFAIRPFTAKLSGAIQQGVVSLVLIVSGLYGLSQQVAELEQQKALGEISDIVPSVNAILAQSNATMLLVLRIGMTLLPLALLALAFYIAVFKYHIDESTYQNMVKEIAQRQQKASD